MQSCRTLQFLGVSDDHETVTLGLENLQIGNVMEARSSQERTN